MIDSGMLVSMVTSMWTVLAHVELVIIVIKTIPASLPAGMYTSAAVSEGVFKKMKALCVH